MKIVIDIPKSLYEAYKERGKRATSDELIIAHGTPLPEGHGRLIDVSDLLDVIELEDNDYNREENVGEIITLEDIDRIPTIIEADEGEEE